jgi:hypothetical protein
MVRSRSTRSFSVGVWTRPTLTKSLPRRWEARVRNRVSEAPQTRSMTCRASPAAARSKSISSGSANARLTSGAVSEENRTRSTLTEALASRTMS